MIGWRAVPLAAIMTAGALAIACHAAAAATFYVPPQGRDTNPGTEGQPFATLQWARDEIRQRRADGTLPAGEITVELYGG